MTDVVIVGAGAAGIGAARRLAAGSVKAVVIEAGPNLGGRACTQTAEGMALDLGCGWLHSADRNPWATIAAERGFAIDRRAPAWGTQYRDLGFPPRMQEQARAAMDAWIARLAEMPENDCAAQALAPDTTWHPYIRAIVSFISGTELERISACDFTCYDQAATTSNWRVPAGYGALVSTSMPPDTPVYCSTRAERIALESGGVRLETNAGTLRARAVIITVSTAVLASNAIQMPAMLDPWRDAARQLPLGRNEKVFLGIEAGAPFEDETMLLGNPYNPSTGAYYIRPFGWPVIECFLGAASADRLAQEGAATAAAVAVDELASLLGPGIRSKLRLITASNWTRTSRIGGGYSCALPGAAAQRRQLACPFEDRIFFAGEATSETDFSTTHGAFASGQRAAEEVLTALSSRAP